jgi:sialate O-acetylesterase
MVLQREKPIHIWGKGLPGKTVLVSFEKTNKTCKIKSDSAWGIYFPAQKASKQPQTIAIVSGTDKTVLENILVGDVWLCIGQSNMEWPMVKEIHYKEELQTSNQPLLRLYNPTYAGKNTFNVSFTDSIIQNLTTENFYKGHWQTCDSNSFKTMSAAAYYFGKEIADNINVPIGLINLSIGGASLETFIGTGTLKGNNMFSKKLYGDWLENNALPVWARERGKQNTGSVNNVPNNENGNNHAYKPGFAYSAGIEPLFPFAIKGILNYQGESNAQEIERVNEYAALSRLMIDDYRKKWKQPVLPFYFVQLSSIDTVKYKGQLWPEFRNEQRKMMQFIRYSGMAVCSDIGAKDDVHPTNKKDVGERLARWALSKTYGHSIVPSGPLPKTAKYVNGKLIISFQYMGEGLKTSDGGSLKGFSIDSKNEIDALFGDDGILVFTDAKPNYVYYGWKPYSDGNLVNSENLPASTFKIKVQ